MSAPPTTSTGQPLVARRMSASEQLRAEKKPRRLIQLLIGLTGYGTALALLVGSELGASSWNVLAEGIAHRSGLTFGMATNLIALVVLVFWIPLRELPGLGTVLNVVLVGAAADVAAHLIPAPATLVEQLTHYSLGLVMFAFFDALYLGARFGSGPRDGLMTGATRVTGQPLWKVRTSIEVLVVAIGWVLGGTVGAGTLILALAAGPLVQAFLRHTTVPLRIDNPAASTAH
ncbi:YitT family protein [Kocuria arenosa]|uniref:membrane protein YczE n=1 Tax=Kocuria arenosa TaxID=3071446 RepID=UPI0034D6D722